MPGLTLIDGNSLLFRAFYGVHGRLTRSDGTPVNAVYGFCNMLLPLLSAAGPDDVFICVFDTGRKNFRNDIYPQYKANRAETPADLVIQRELVADAVRAFNIPCLEIQGVEADDVIATLAAHECAIGKQTRIVTGDKDLMQLVSDCVYLYDGMKQKDIHEPDVFEKFGVRPDQVIDVQSLMGDSSDNVPGVPGIGPKTAAELIREFGDLNNLYANLDSIKNERRRNLLADNRDMAYISKQLVTLKTDVTLPEFSYAPYWMDVPRAIDFIVKKIESNSLVARINKLFSDKKSNSPDRIIAPVPSCGEPTQVDMATPVKNITIENATYKTITTESELDEFLSRVHDIIAFDTETTGLDNMTAKIVGISLATSSDFGAYIPIGHKPATTDLFGGDDSGAPEQLSFDVVKNKLARVFENPDILKVGHNLKYDLHILENMGWDTDKITPIDDSMLLSYILHGTAHNHNMDELANLYLGHENISFDSLFPPKTKSADKHFESLDIKIAAPYAAEDAYVSFALYELFRNQLDQPQNGDLKKLYENCDRPLLRVLLQMERMGILVDRGMLHTLSKMLHEKADELAREIWDAVGTEFNIGSPKQLGAVLYDQLNIPGPKNRSTDAATLSEMAYKHPILDKILEWRSLTKLSGTYADALPGQIARDGRIHTTFLQTSTNTGRLSSRDPNLQNIPIKSDLGAEIRRAFVAPPGRVLISADYSQIQLRLLAHVANVESLKTAFLNGEDIHEMTARKIFNIAADAPVPRDMRRAAKTVNFSIIYGVSPFGLSDQLKTTPGDARKIIESYMAGFPEINEYMDKTKEFALKHGYVLTPWGRRIELPDVKNPRRRAYALRAAINAPIQGFEADLMRFAMVKLRDLLAGQNDCQMLLQIHDEIVFECDANTAEDWAKKIEHSMETVTKLSIPLSAEYTIGTSWEK